MEKKQVYEKPLLRKVRLEVKTSVLAGCHTSIDPAPNTPPLGCSYLGNNCLLPE